MVCCSFVGCKSKYGSPNIKFHRIPKARCKLWGRIINRKDFTPTRHSRVCSLHFVSGYPGWEPSDPDWIPTLNIEKNKTISPRKLKLTHLRRERVGIRSQKKEEAYQTFVQNLTEKRLLNLSLKFHDYASSGISVEETSFTVSSSDLSIMSNGVEPYSQVAEESTVVHHRRKVTREMTEHTTSLGTQTDERQNVNLRDEINKFSQGNQTDYFDYEHENRNLRIEISNLKKRLKEKTWGVNKIKDNDEMTRFYVGLPTYAIFLWLFGFLEKKAENMIYWRGGRKEGVIPMKKRYFKLSLIDQFFAVMVRLKVGLFIQDIADRFDISPSTFSDMFATWIKLMDIELSAAFPFPSKALIEKYMPQCFMKYPNTRIITDCTEIFLERSTSLTAQNLTFSNYKNHNTMKFLVGITPGGVISFISEGWGGRVSDKVITKDSNLILLLDEGDNVMADKGFLIADLLNEKKCGLNLPPFLKDRSQFTEKEIVDTRRIAEVRINVERSIRRIKKFHIFDGIMPITLAKEASSIFSVCCYITNIYEPLS